MTKVEDRIAKAIELHKEGYNCSQCVWMVYDDLYNLSQEIAAAISSGFGGGVGAQGDICGAVSGMVMIEGLLKYNSPKSKPLVYTGVKSLCSQFIEENGSTTCRILKSKETETSTPKHKPCMEYIIDAIKIIDKNFVNKQ